VIAITSESAGCLRQAGQILADIARSDAGEFEGAGFAPGQELPDGMQVSPTSVFIADRAEEEFLGREYRRRASANTTLVACRSKRRKYWGSLWKPKDSTPSFQRMLASTVFRIHVDTAGKKSAYGVSGIYPAFVPPMMTPYWAAAEERIFPT